MRVTNPIKLVELWEDVELSVKIALDEADVIIPVGELASEEGTELVVTLFAVVVDDGEEASEDATDDRLVVLEKNAVVLDTSEVKSADVENTVVDKLDDSGVALVVDEMFAKMELEVVRFPGDTDPLDEAS